MIGIDSLLEAFCAPVRDSFIEWIKREYGYFFKHKGKVTNLNEQMQKLKAAKERVEHDVESARRDAMKVYEDVEKWLEASNAKLDPENTKELDEATKKAEVLCSLRLCGNLWFRRQLSKKAEKESEVVGKLLEQYSESNNFERVGDRPVTQGIRHAQVQEFHPFESRDITFKGIMAALKDPNVQRIGVFGMGGIGKTTLLKKIECQAREDRLCDDFVNTALTTKPNIRKNQEEIADQLGLKLRSKSESGRATEIADRMNSGRKILIILDDIWDELKLEEIGISISSQRDQTGRGRRMSQSNTVSNCKLLMASRASHVLDVMRSDKNFQVATLSYEESKVLFTDIVGDIATQPNYKQSTDEIIRKCEGLPLAVEALGKALLNYSLDTWKDVCRKLERSGIRKINEVDKSVHIPLKLSYDMLEDKEAQQLFLLCGMHSQGSDIHIAWLVWYSVGLGLFSGSHTLDEARTRVNALLDKLKAHSMLLGKGSRDGTVKMHDLFRDVAINIAERDKMLVMENETDLKSPSTIENLIHSKSITLPSGIIHELPDSLECPKLEMFWLTNELPSLRVPDNFFQQMTELKVLDLTGLEELSGLPKSLGSLTTLQTLCLDGCSGMRDISSIGKLDQLDILSLRGSDIEELPEDMKHLRRLRVLNLSECEKLKVIPANVISSLTRLEELYMSNSLSRWNVEDNRLSELKDLPHLKVLQLDIFSGQIIPQDLDLTNLISYKICVGDRWGDHVVYDNLRQLQLKLEDGTHLNRNIKQLLENTEELRLNNLPGVRDFLGELDRQGFQQLQTLVLENSPCVQYLINFEDVIPCSKVFPSLETLSLKGLRNFEEICHGQPTAEAFMGLNTLKVEDCGKLKKLFTCSASKYLLQLEKIEVTDCDNFVGILGGEMETAWDMEFLKKVLSLTLRRLPKFVSLLPQDQLQSLFNEKVQLPQLQKLQLSMINVKHIWPEGMPSTVSSGLGNLTHLIIENCSNLQHLFSFSIARSLKQLKQLQVSGCERMKVIVDVKEREATNELDNTISFPQLNFLGLKGLQNLIGFCYGNCNVDFPSLKKLEITMCPDFEGFSLMYESNIGSKEGPLFNKKVTLSKVETIVISHIRNKRMLWDDELSEGVFSNLKELSIKLCKNLKILFNASVVHKFKGLELLHVRKCDALEVIFEFQFLHKLATTSHIIEAQLKYLYCRHLPKLKHVWSMNPKGVVSFHKLEELSVWNCEELRYVLPVSVARFLPQLIELSIARCGKVEEIVAYEERSFTFEFPQVSFLFLLELPNLKWFYRGKHSTSWPMLSELEAYDHGQLKLFGFNEEVHQTNDALCQPLFSSIQVIHKLQSLPVENVDMIKRILEGAFGSLWMDHVNVLFVSDTDHSHAGEVADFLPELLQKFPHLEILRLNDCEGVVPWEAIPHLNWLVLCNLPSLEESWSQQCSTALNVLECLEVIYCPNLLTLSHPWASFENLTVLYLQGCHRMTHVFSSSTVSSLLQLKRMTIRECRMVTSVISREEEGETSKRSITFKSLEVLRFKNLPSFTCFSSMPANLSYSFPSLQTLTVNHCPKLSIFCEGQLHTPTLKFMQLVDADEADCAPYWLGNINMTIQQIRSAPQLNNTQQ